MDVKPHQPCTFCVNEFEDKPVYLVRQIAMGIALLSPAQILTAGTASSRVAEVEQRGEEGHEWTPNTETAMM